LVAIVVVTAATSDNVGGIAAVSRIGKRSTRFRKLWCDSGFKSTFIDYCRHHHISAEVVSRIHASGFHALPKRWIVERTWAWLMNNRRLQVDYERDPEVTEGFIWAAQSRLLMRRLVEPASAD
jgi:transposase